jgi:glycine betaine/proline transport system ATP-binding protein
VELQKPFISLRESLTKTSVFVTHDVREALAVSTRTALLNRGRLEFLGTPSQLLRSESDEAQAFLACLGGEWEKREA